jgi:hypothetical protein
MPTVDDSLLPSFDLRLNIAMDIIKKNIKCVPSDLYFKRWCKLKNKKII